MNRYDDIEQALNESRYVMPKHEKNPEQVTINPDSKSIFYLTSLGLHANQVCEVRDEIITSPDSNGYSIYVYSDVHSKWVHLGSNDYIL